MAPTSLFPLADSQSIAETLGDAARAWDDFVRAAVIDPSRRLDADAMVQNRHSGFFGIHALEQTTSHEHAIVPRRDLDRVAGLRLLESRPLLLDPLLEHRNRSHRPVVVAQLVDQPVQPAQLRHQQHIALIQLLQQLIDPRHPLSADLSAMLIASRGGKRHEGYRKIPLSDLSVRLVADSGEAIATRAPIELSYQIRNVDRTIGSRLSGEITARHGSDGLPESTIVVRFEGTAGQSFGAWLCRGVDLHLAGTSNDYLGKGMGGGLISVSPRRPNGRVSQAAGNAVLYGATGGKVFLAGRVAQRFAVRNSGATAVIEGCSDHGCEYMTGGKVLVIGNVGRNFDAFYFLGPRDVFSFFTHDATLTRQR